MDFSKAMGPAYAVAENTEELKAELADAGCKSKRNKLFIGLTAGVAIVLGAYNGYEWMFASDHVETDNAYVDADVAQVTPQLSAPARNYSCPIRKRSAVARNALATSQANVTAARAAQALAAANRSSAVGTRNANSAMISTGPIESNPEVAAVIAPIVDLRTFRRRGFSMSVLTYATGVGAFFATLVILPLWPQQNMGYTATQADYATRGGYGHFRGARRLAGRQADRNRRSAPSRS